MSSNLLGLQGNETPPTGEAWVRQVIDAVRGIRYGSVEVVVHDGRVVQIERRMKVRLDVADRRPPDIRPRETRPNGGAHRPSGGTPLPDDGEEENDR